MSNHTSGPWNLDGSSFAHTIRANGIHIATTAMIVYARSNGVHEEYANACLIAAGPELLLALQQAATCFNDQHNLLSTATNEDRRRVVENFIAWWNNTGRMTLAKAEGRSS